MRFLLAAHGAALAPSLLYGGAAENWVRSYSEQGSVPLVASGHTAPVVLDENDHEVVSIAAADLAADIERVAGKKPPLRHAWTGRPVSSAILIGSIDRSALIRALVDSGKLSVEELRGQWESFVITSVEAPFPGMQRALVVVGSDRRGTAYGVYELSQAMGVSPWYWWADVAPVRQAELHVAGGTRRFGPPSVKYRGIFINDEDWGLQPWAAKTFEPETGDIGPKTYAKVCELLLRLKANYLWPAMHECTKAFNHFPENKVVADRYAIVMGSSHAEPMLRNNVDEWPHDQTSLWNPVTNLPGVLEYWEQRVRENGRHENVYTVGMRGIHDSGMPGGGTLVEKRDRLEKIIDLQREMLARHVYPDPSRVPQIFVPYKEVLEIYQTGMKVPDDITLVWPDDNFGYVRQLPNARERQRSGGHGIYYHLSYWGRPHDYLWVDSTAPALVWHEMTKAYELGARRLWVGNVGDLKSIESGTTLFLELAWDIDRYGKDVQQTFLRHFAAQQFGEAWAEQIAALRDEYFRLCAIRRPEHFGFNRVYFSRAVPNSPVQNTEWSHAPENDEAGKLMERWLELARSAEALAAKLPAESRDAYFQLVEYPAVAGAAMAEKIIAAEKARLTGSAELAARAERAFRRIEQLTERYNALQGGKWRGIKDHQPRRLPVFDMPPTTPQGMTASASSPAAALPKRAMVFDAANFDRVHDRDGAGWRVIEGLGPRGHAITVLPHRDVPTLRSPQEIRDRAPVANYRIEAARVPTGEVAVTVEALPTRPLTPEHEVVAAISIDDGDPVLVRFENGIDDENDPIWQANVLRSVMAGSVTLHVPIGASTLKLWAADSSVVVQRITFVRHPAEVAPR